MKKDYSFCNATQGERSTLFVLSVQFYLYLKVTKASKSKHQFNFTCIWKSLKPLSQNSSKQTNGSEGTVNLAQIYRKSCMGNLNCGQSHRRMQRTCHQEVSMYHWNWFLFLSVQSKKKTFHMPVFFHPIETILTQELHRKVTFWIFLLIYSSCN